MHVCVCGVCLCNYDNEVRLFKIDRVKNLGLI